MIFLQLKGTGAPHSLGTSQPWIAIIVPSCHREPLQHGTGVRTVIESSFISDAFSTEHSYMCFFLSFQVLGLMIYSKKINTHILSYHPQFFTLHVCDNISTTTTTTQSSSRVSYGILSKVTSQKSNRSVLLNTLFSVATSSWLLAC